MDLDAVTRDEYIAQQPEEIYSSEPPTKSVLRTAIRWIVYVGAFLLPLWFLPFTADVVDFNKQVLLLCVSGIGLILYLIDVIKSGWLSYRRNILYWAWGGLIAAGIVSVIFSVNRFSSMFGIATNHATALINTIAFFVLFFLAITVIEDRGTVLKEVLKTSIIIALVIGLLEAMGIVLFSGPYEQPGFSTTGTLNGLAMLGAAFLPLFISFANSSGKRKFLGTIINVIGLVSVFTLLIIINWWPVWIIAFAGALAHIMINSSVDLKRGRMKFFALPMAIVVAGILFWLFGFNIQSIKTKLPVEVSPSYKASYGVAYKAFISKPLGYGLENFTVVYDKFRSPSSVNNPLYQLRFTEATGEAANAAAEGGIALILAYLLFAWMCIKFFIRFLKNRDINSLYSSEAGTVWAAVAALAVSLVLFSATMTVLVCITLLLVLATRMSGQDDNSTKAVYNLEDDTKLSFIGSAAFIIGLALVVVAGYFTFGQYRGNMLFAKAARATDADPALQMYLDSINNNRYDARVYRALSQRLLQKVADDIQKAQKDKTVTEEFTSIINRQIQSAVSAAVEATRVDSSDSENWMNSGFIYQNFVGLAPEAETLSADMYKESIARYPNNPLAYFRLGNLYLSLADRLIQTSRSASKDKIDENLNMAEENFKQAVALYNNYGQALYNLAATYDRMGRIPQAVRQFEKLSAGQSRDPSISFQLGLLYYRNGQKDEAVRAWEKSIALSPNYSNARWYLSLAYEERGNLQGALDHVREIEKFNRDNELVKERIAKLEAGIRTIPPAKVLDQKPL